jgi:hypothetical protein
MSEVTAVTGIGVAVVYNPFKSNEVERLTVPFSAGSTLGEYLGDLGDGCWSVGYRGEAYEQDRWSEVVLCDGDVISLVAIPEGGGGGGGSKDIMRMVAMIAIMVVATAVIGPWAAGLTSFAGATATAGASAGFMAVSALAAASFAAAGMMIVNAVLPPAEMTEQNTGGASYGMDGPKNTSQEGIAVPIVFGKYRVAGNIVDNFTKNIGDEQYLFMRIVLNDGQVKSCGEFEINEQPIENFTDVQTRVSLGDNDGEENDWFGESIRMVSRNVELTTNWLVHTTEDEVDRVRLDLYYPSGLGYHKDDGRILAAESDIRFEYRPFGSTGAWAPLSAGVTKKFIGYQGGTYGMTGYGGSTPHRDIFDRTVNAALVGYDVYDNPTLVGGSDAFITPSEPVTLPDPRTGQPRDVIVSDVPAGASRMTIQSLAEVASLEETSPSGTYSMRVCYREIGSPTWLTLGDVDGTATRSSASFELIYRTHTIALDPAKVYEVTAFGGTITNGEALVTSGGDGELHFLRAKKEAFRYSYESGILPFGRYSVRVRRLKPVDTTNAKRQDGVYLQDVAEIEVDNIHYVGTANVSLKIKLGEQLNAVNRFTSMVEGVVVKQFDEDGNVVAEAWSPWPVWQILDILLNEDRGRGLPSSRIDFPSAKEFEAHCIEHNLQFNGVFDSMTNVWEAIQTICRVGHAQIVRIGTRYSFVLDRKTDAVMLFNDSNIIEGTFTTTWLPMTGRANEIQYTFYPEDEGFKEKMLRVIDPDAQNSSTGLRVAKITEKGVTNYEQALYNVEKQLRENKLLDKTVTFDAPIEAIGLTIGDVAAIQHSSAHYGKGIGTGRLALGSTSTVLKLDCPVTMQAGTPYRVLLVHSAVRRFTVTVQQVIGNTVYVSGLPAGEMPRCTRLKQDGIDTAINNILDGVPYDRVVVDKAHAFTVGSLVELWDTDVIEERDVVYAAGDNDIITLAAPLAAEPARHAIWMVGPVSTVKRLFRLRGVGGEGLHRRTLNFASYDERIYLPMGAVVQRPVPQPSTIPDQVKRLSISYPGFIEGSLTRITGLVSWEADDTRYAGADIYIDRNGSGFSYLRSLTNVTSFEMELTLGDDIQVKVVAFGTNGRRALASEAPVVGDVVAISPEDLEAISSLVASRSAFKVDGTITLEWGASPSLTARNYRMESIPLTQAAFDAIADSNPTYTPAPETVWTYLGTTSALTYEIPRQDVGLTLFRVRAENGRAQSPWVYEKFSLQAPALPVQVTGLRADGQAAGPTSFTFAGQDAKIVWNNVKDDAQAALDAAIATGTATAAQIEVLRATVNSVSSYIRDYVVRITDTSGTLIRQETTVDPYYVYSIEKNFADHLGNPAFRARRVFKVEVLIRGQQGQLSTAAVISMTNPAPAVPTVRSASPTFQGFQLVLEDSNEPDVVGGILWVSTVSGFTPNDANKVFQGQGALTFIGEGSTEYFYRYARYDAFGIDQLNVSSQTSTTSSGITADVFGPEFFEQFNGILEQAQGGADAAEDARDAARIAETNAETAESNAELAFSLAQGEYGKTVIERQTAQGAASTATSARDIAVGARDNALGHAGAAATSRSDASTFAGQAGTARQQSEAARDAAGIARDQADAARVLASGFASAASLSSSSASTFANNAGLSATAADLSRTAAEATTRFALPSNFNEGGTHFTNDVGTNALLIPTTLTLDATRAFRTVVGLGKVWETNTGQQQIGTKGFVALIAGRTHRLSAYLRVLTNGARAQQWVTGFHVFDASGNDIGQSWLEFSPTRTASQGWYVGGGIVTTDALQSVYPGAAYIRPAVIMNWSNGAVTGSYESGAVSQIAYLKYEDITESEKAKTSAGASFDSAVVASGHASTSLVQAGIAFTQRGLAEGARGSAETFRDEASDFRDEASGFSSTASTFSGSAATALNGVRQALALTFPNDVTRNDIWTANEGAGTSLNPGDLDPTFFITATDGTKVIRTPGSNVVSTRAFFVPTGGRKYRLTISARRVSGGSSNSNCWVGFTAMTAAGGFDFLGGGQTFASKSASGSEWVSFSFTWECPLVHTYVAVRPRSHNDSSISGATIDIRSFKFEDVSESSAAAGFVTDASVQAGLAGTRATAALGSQTLADGYRGEALTFRNQASGYSDAALAQAAIATEMAGLSANYSTTAINKNPLFSKPIPATWTNGIPVDWTDWNGGFGTRNTTVTVQADGSICYEVSIAAGVANQGVLQTVQNVREGWYVLEATVSMPVAGSHGLRGVSLMFVPQNAALVAQDYGKRIDLFVDPDTSGAVVGAGVGDGRAYRFSKLVKVGDSQTRTGLLHVMSRWEGAAGYVSGQSAATIRWHKAAVRPATAGEIETGIARLNSPTLSARVTQVDQARADGDTSLALRVTKFESRSDTGNLLRKAQFIQGKPFAPWTAGSNRGATGSVAGVWGPTQFSIGPEECSLYYQQTDNVQGHIYDYSLAGTRIEGGKRYCFSVYAGAHRADATLYIDFFNAAGTYMESTYNTTQPGYDGSNALLNAEVKYGGTSLAAFQRLWTFVTSPPGAASCTVVMRKTATKTIYPDSYAFWTRPMLSLAKDTDTAPPPWSGAAVEASVIQVVQAETDLRGRVQATAGMTVQAGNRVAGMRFHATDGTDASYSSIDFMADTFRVWDSINTIGTAPFEIRNGGLRVRSVSVDELAVGARMTVGTAKLKIQVQPFDLNLTDGQAVNFGYDLGNNPSLTFAGNNLAPLNAGETYKLYADSLTPTGFIARLKIETPASPSNVAIGPVGNSPNGVTSHWVTLTGTSSTGSYQVRANGYVRSKYFNQRPLGNQPNYYYDETGGEYTDGELWLAVWGFNGSAWVQIGNLYPQPAFRYNSTTGTYDDYYDITDSIAASANITHIGVSVEYATYPLGNNISNLWVNYQTQATGGGLRSATPGGQQTTITVRPKT